MPARLITHHSLLITAFLAAGCGGHGTLHLVPIDQNRIDRKAPLLVEIGPARCSYRVEGETILIALEREQPSILGEYGRRAETVSIVVEGLPAHQARDYRLNRTSIRGRLRKGAQHARFASIGGILALWFEPDGTLTGRLRALVKEQQFNIIMGWTSDSRALLVGEFTATRDAPRAEAVRRRSEHGGLERSPDAAQPKPEPVTGPEPGRSQAPAESSTSHPARPRN